MKTFLLDLHGGALRSGPAAPLLYPLQAEGALRILGPDGPRGGSVDPGELAERVRVALVRRPVQRWLALFLVELAAGEGAGRSAGLVGQIERIRAGFLEPLAARGLAPARALVVAVDGLAREPHTGAPFDATARRQWTEDVEKLGASPGAVLEELTVLRFPLRRHPEPAFQHDLIHLAYLLLATIELVREQDEPPRGRLLRVDQVELDGQEIGEWLAAYGEQLRAAERQVARRLEQPAPVELQLIRDAACACGHPLPPTQLSEPRWGWFRRTDDLHGWRNWTQRTGAALAQRAEEGETMLRRCIDQRRTHSFPTVTEKVSSLEETVNRLQEQLHQARRALAQAGTARDEEWDWEQEMQRRTPRIRALLEARPRSEAFWISVAALLLLLLVPGLLLLPGSGPARLLVPAVLLLGGTALAAWLALRSVRARLVDHAHGAHERAQKIAHLIGERTDRRRRHLERLCEVEAARRNVAAAAEAQREQGREVLLLKHHRAELRRHLDLAEAMRTHLAPDSPADRGEAAATATPGREWPLEVPPHRHPTYAPALCGGRRADHLHSLRVGVRRVDWRSALACGLRQLRLSEDPFYAPAEPREGA